MYTISWRCHTSERHQASVPKLVGMQCYSPSTSSQLGSHLRPQYQKQKPQLEQHPLQLWTRDISAQAKWDSGNWRSTGCGYAMIRKHHRSPMPLVAESVFLSTVGYTHSYPQAASITPTSIRRSLSKNVLWFNLVWKAVSLFWATCHAS